MGVTLGHRPGAKLSLDSAHKGPAFGRFLESPLGLPLLKGALDAGIGLGGQLWGWAEGAAEESAQEKAQADYNRRLKENTSALQRAAEAELGAMEEMAAGPAAFIAGQEAGPLPDYAGAVSPGQFQSSLVQQASPGLVQPRPRTRGMAMSPILALQPGLAPEDLDAEAAAQELARHQAAMAREAAPPTGATVPRGRPVDPRLEQIYQATGGLIRPHVSTYADVNPTEQWHIGEDPPARVMGAPLPQPLYEPQQTLRAPSSLTIPTDPAVTAQQRQDVELRRAALRDAVGQEALRRQAMREIGPRPEAPPIRMAAILAAAPAARTARERAMLLKAAESSPDVQPTNWDDFTTNAHKKRAIEQVAKLFPKEPKPERPMSELDRLRMLKTSEEIKSSRLRQQKLQAELDKEAAKAAKVGSALSKRDPDKSKAHNEWAFYYANFNKHHEGKMGDDVWEKGAGRFASVDPPGMMSAGHSAGVSRGLLKKATTSSNSIISMMKTKKPTPPRVPPSLLTARRKLVGDIEDGRELLTRGQEELERMAETNSWYAPREVMARQARARRELRELDEQIKQIKEHGPPTGGAVYNAAAGEWE